MPPLDAALGGDASDIPARPTSGPHAVAMLAAEIEAHLEAIEHLLAGQVTASDRRWAELRREVTQLRRNLDSLAAAAKARGADIASSRAQLDALGRQVAALAAQGTSTARDVAAILETLGAIVRELGTRATQDSIHDDKIARQETRMAKVLRLVSWRGLLSNLLFLLGGALAHLALKYLGSH